MRHTDTIEVHYPTTVLERSHEDVDGLNDGLFEVIKQLEEKFADSDENAVRQGTVSTQGGYQTSTGMNLFDLKEEPIKRFREELVMPAVRRYLEEVFGKESSSLAPWPVGWSNLLRAGDWQGPHMHPTDKNLISGVYYVRIPEAKPEPEGCIEFINPHLQSVHHGFSTTRRLHPAEGKLILFPPYYVHYVHPFKGEGERVIIAFDILAQKPGLQFVF